MEFSNFFPPFSQVQTNPFKMGVSINSDYPQIDGSFKILMENPFKWMIKIGAPPCQNTSILVLCFNIILPSGNRLHSSGTSHPSKLPATPRFAPVSLLLSVQQISMLLGAVELFFSSSPYANHGAGIFTYIYPKNHQNVGKYTIHGASGISSECHHRKLTNSYISIYFSDGWLEVANQERLIRSPAFFIEENHRPKQIP